MNFNRATKNQFRSIICKIFKMADKTKQYITDIARKLIVQQQQQYLFDPEMKIAEYLLEKMSNLKDIEQSLTAGKIVMEKFFEVIGVVLSGKIKHELQTFVQNILEGIKPDSQIVVNAWHEDNKNYDCICGRAYGMEGLAIRYELCYKCGRMCHVDCFWSREGTENSFECPICFLSFCNPQREVIQIIFAGYLKASVKEQIEYKIKFFTDIKKDYANIEIRCCRLNAANRFQMTFPQKSTFHFNGQKVAEFKSLSLTSPLKRRNDDAVPISKFNLFYLNTIKIQEKHQNVQGQRNTTPSNHMFIIASVIPIPQLRIQKKFFENHLEIQQSKQFLKEYLAGENCELAIEKINLSMKCQYYKTNIVMPVRSKHCPHYQPIDLSNFVRASIASKNSTQRWRCPICKKRAYDLVLDDYLYSLIKNQSDISSITFSSQGDLIALEHEAENEDDEDYSREQKQEKRQKMEKSQKMDKIAQAISQIEINEQETQPNEIMKQTQVILIQDSDIEQAQEDSKQFKRSFTDRKQTFPSQYICPPGRKINKSQKTSPSSEELVNNLICIDQQSKQMENKNSTNSKISQQELIARQKELLQEYLSNLQYTEVDKNTIGELITFNKICSQFKRRRNRPK